MAERVDGNRWTIRDAPPAHVPRAWHEHAVHAGRPEWFQIGNWHKLVEHTWDAYLKTLSHDRRELLSHFTAQDLVFKVVGVGSVGTRCLVLLSVDHMGKPLFLQIKEARQSVIAQYYKAPTISHEGERVVQGQRMLQAASDIFLGWATGPSGRHFYFRQLRDMKLSANIELFDTESADGLCEAVRLDHGACPRQGEWPGDRSSARISVAAISSRKR